MTFSVYVRELTDEERNYQSTNFSKGGKSGVREDEGKFLWMYFYCKSTFGKGVVLSERRPRDPSVDLHRKCLILACGDSPRSRYRVDEKGNPRSPTQGTYF